MESIVRVGAVLLVCSCLLQSPALASEEHGSAGDSTSLSAKSEAHAIMKGTHIHLGVRDLAAAIEWIERVWQLKPTLQTERMAIFPFGPISLFLDASDQDSRATIGFESQHCDQDYRSAIKRGAVSMQEPKDEPWGVRAAYVRGPGALKFEIEQQLKR